MAKLKSKSQKYTDPEKEDYLRLIENALTQKTVQHILPNEHNTILIHPILRESPKY